MPLNIEIQRSPATARSKRPDPATLGFGRVFSDHMFLMDYDAEKGWHSARIVPRAPLSLDPAAAALHYGQALFEGLKAFRGSDDKIRLFRPDFHAHRMAEGTARLCMPAVDPEHFLRAVTELCLVDADWVPSAPGTALYIRPALIATEAFLGVRPARRYTFMVLLSPVGSYYDEGGAPLRIWVERHSTRAARGGLGAVKAGANYAASLLAAEQAKSRGYAQVLWLDARSHTEVEEVGTMNVFVRIGETVVTPPLGGTILAGATRDACLTLLRAWGVVVEERTITLDELASAQRLGTLREVFGSGTAAVISPVGELAGDGFGPLVIGDGKTGAIARRLHATITGVQRGAEPDTYGWMKRIG